MIRQQRAAFLLNVIAATLCLRAAHGELYTFDALLTGPLSGQDAWGATSNASIVAATNGSLGFTGGAAARPNNAAWSFPTITETSA